LIIFKAITSVETIVKQAEEIQKLRQRLIEPFEAIHASIERNVPYTFRPNLPDIPHIDWNFEKTLDDEYEPKPKHRIGFNQ